ncbi:peptidoglycan-binding protein [Planktothrix agardhii]|uniref:peptidoglycan-binding protein n=1 Tax=Planktothrix agardhii TaxID=1160 RepID=UPI001F458B8D|nr:transporter substrate-binding domain-containing protein [Planktothrix agardhii]MCF3577135.1 transporter substrate-binding domain-containing protein [Planktothrix agardhii 1812]
MTFQSNLDQPLPTPNSQGNQVIDLQTQLKKRGYYPGALDGVYGEGTQEAVYNLQVSMGLEATGTVDPQTWQYLQPNDSTRAEATSTIGLTDIKIAQDLATALGVSLKIDRTAKTFNDVVDIVNSQKADLGISKLSQTLARAKMVSFSRPYLTLRHGLLINRLQLAKASKGKDMVDFLKNFEGKIGVIQGSSYVGFTKEKFPQAKIVEFTTWEDVIKAAINGDVLAAYRDELEVKKIILNQPNIALNFKTVALSDSYDPIAIALPWSSGHLLQFVNLYLDLNKINYTVDSLIEEYSHIFGKTGQPKPQ